MITNADITIYNRKANPDTRKMEYCRTIVKGVHWYAEQKTTVTDNGLKSADVHKIRIPAESLTGYLPAEEYAALPWGEREQHWTIENGDLFASGAVSTDITKPSQLAGLRFGQVLSWSDNRRGMNPHIRIGGA